MEPISKDQLTSTSSQQQTQETKPNSTCWQQFFENFSPLEKTHFMQNMTHELSRMIQNDLRKMRENLRKLRENL